MGNSFNLLTEKWIPVILSNGTVEKVGILAALTQAARIRQIAANNPMDRFAILRFMLALVYWSKGNPPKDTTDSGGAFPAQWFTKLENEKGMFDLLGPERRFYQYRKGDGKDQKLAATYLSQEVPTGTNKWHFRHATDKTDGLCPACCAMGLLRLPAFATSAGRGKPPGVNAKPPLYVVPIGASLAETIRLSWEPVEELGTPTWEKPDIRLPDEGVVPLLTGLTWLPRRVWLDSPAAPEANCIACGAKTLLIRETVFAPIGSTKTDESSPGRTWRDPHVMYEETRTGDIVSLHSGDALGSADAAAGQWARIMAAIVERHGRKGGRALWVVGFSTVQNDKYLEAFEQTLPWPESGDRNAEIAARFAQWSKEGVELVKRLRPCSEKKSGRKHVEIPPALAAVRPQVEDQVSQRAEELLLGGEAAWEKAAQEYRPMMEAVAKSLSPGFTSSAVDRRRQIAAASPDMGARSETPRKFRSKKGGKT